MLLLADVMAVVCAFLLVYVSARRASQLAWVCAAELLIVVAGAKLLGLYDRDETLLRKTTLEEIPTLFQLATFITLVAWLASASEPRTLGRIQVVTMWLTLIALFTLLRTAARAVALRTTPPERLLFVGDGASAEAIGSKLAHMGGVRATIAGYLDFDSVDSWSSDARTPSKLDGVRALAHQLDVHRAIVSPSGADSEEVLNLVRTFKAVGIRVSVLPRLLEVIGSSVEFDDLHGVTVMGVRRFELTRFSAVTKRAFDLLFASLALLAMAPLMLITAIAIKLDTPGPVFFRQRRVGRYGRHFQIIKFRTMVRDAEALKRSLDARNEAEEMFKIADDPRVTRVGRVLRTTALDELPQLLNILKGEMSVVGPRPLILEEDERIEGWHRRRLELTPGMTGPWQILGPTRVPLREMVAIDYLYVANWSLWCDVKILLRTVAFVAGRRGL